MLRRKTVFHQTDRQSAITREPREHGAVRGGGSENVASTMKIKDHRAIGVIYAFGGRPLHGNTAEFVPVVA